MNEQQKEVLWNLQREKVEQFLNDMGYDLGELMRDRDGYYVDTALGEKFYLPKELTTI